MNIALNSYFSQNGIAKALNIYNFPEDYEDRPFMFLRAVRYILNFHSKYKPLPSILSITNRCLEMIKKFKRSNYIEGIRELIDILIEFIPERKQEFLNILRNDINDEKNIIYISPSKKHNLIINTKNTQHKITNNLKSVYSDSQNVHNSTINSSVIDILKIIYEKYKHIIYLSDKNEDQNFEHKINMLNQIQNTLIEEFKNETELIINSIEYIKKSTAIFSEKYIDMSSCFISVWLWISEHPDFSELKKRLIQELTDMKGLCTTGHIARIINVIQGFTGNEINLEIKISPYDQMTSVIKNYLTKCLINCENDDVLSQMTEGGELFIKFIRVAISKKILEWQNEYGKESLKYIAQAVNDFSKVEIFKVK